MSSRQQIEDEVITEIIAVEEGQAPTPEEVVEPTAPQLSADEIKTYPNYAFQLNQNTIKPDRTTTLPMIHAGWATDYSRLEVHHAYIQWLFPLFEPGMNSSQTPLTEEEARLISQSAFAKRNMINSFHMMTNFWGFVFDEAANIVSRHPDPKHVEWAFRNWMNTHNDLRVSRCMRSLYITGQKEVGFAFFKALFQECSPQGYPPAAGLRYALDNFWFPIFETDDLFRDECEQLRTQMEAWPVVKRGMFGW